ncbi:hypothetical protein RJ55_07003 [Drechmeria coniospora]|nr:hypothetical protein RJ55_07003 [Drechmeria coniospora]
MRYKPMTSIYRQFLHVLAEDYGLESQSEDVEPYRYVIVSKGQRFVSAPSKTLAQCVAIKDSRAAEVTAVPASRPQTPRFAPAADPFNGFLLTSPRFGLTSEDVATTLENDFKSQPSLRFAISFLPTDEVLLRASAHYSAFLSPPAMEQALAKLKPRLAKTIGHQSLAGNILLCHVDSKEHVARREDLARNDASGWSAVAGRAAAKSDTSTPTDDPTAKGTGRKLLGLRWKKMEQEKGKPWDTLGSDVEC